MCKIRFYPLRLKDIEKIQNWGVHSDPLLFDYNIEISGTFDSLLFLLYKTLSPFNRYYSIYYRGQMEGFLGLKGINPLTQNSRLGLALNPDRVGKGLGTRVLTQFLDYYFKELKYRTMVLDVAGYNIRAKRLYTNLGFNVIREYEEKYTGGQISLDDIKSRGLEDMFFVRDSVIYYRVYEMELKREDFYEVYNRKK